MGAVKATNAISVQASSGGKRLTLDPIETHTIELEIHEVESTIPAGFQQLWGSVDVNGDELELTSGAGVGSQQGTIHFRDKSYVFNSEALVEAFLRKIDPSLFD